ncbi:MAG: response regulator transcription factor [Lachnospiraceae bacterium]|nr:response regulator transcription factor [Lachnospiraceae bacterium]
MVEDDSNIRELEEYALSNSGFLVKGFVSGTELFHALDEVLPRCIILDIMLPGESGLEILKKLRKKEETRNLPIIMVTAKSTELDKVKGLDMGADDYIAKPFGIMELVSRVKALLRRSEPQKPQTIYQFGNIRLDDEKHLVKNGDVVVDLTFKEYELLKYLLSNIDIVLSREKLMNKVWGFDYEGESRTVDMHIKTLRKKLGDAGDMIKTVRNVGYKIGL